LKNQSFHLNCRGEDPSADQPDVTICIELDTKITVRGKESTLNDLKTGQYVEVLLQRESSKAISINAT